MVGWKKYTVFAALILAVAFGVMVTSLPPEAPLSVREGDVARGAYLARISGCIACHTNTEANAPLAGGYGIKTPFGVLFSPNLTTDKKTGIGDWTIETFGRAVRTGVSPDGQPYYPAFPYRFYAQFSDQDIADLWAAFQTVPPVPYENREHQLAFPYSIRSALYLWRALYFEGRTSVQTDSLQDDQYNRGKYLVEVAGHCAACHTPRGWLGGLQDDKSLQGATILDDMKAPAITPEALKQQGWTLNTLAYGLSTGIKPDGDVMGAAMGEVIRDGLAYLSKADQQAMALYLLSDKSTSTK